MHWLALIVAGLFETGWAISLKYTNGFSRLVPSLCTLAMLGASMVLLASAARHLPMSTAYAVWVSIGVAGVTAVDILYYGQPLTLGRLFFLLLLLIAIIGLKFVK